MEKINEALKELGLHKMTLNILLNLNQNNQNELFTILPHFYDNTISKVKSFINRTLNQELLLDNVIDIVLNKILTKNNTYSNEIQEYVHKILIVVSELKYNNVINDKLNKMIFTIISRYKQYFKYEWK